MTDDTKDDKPKLNVVPIQPKPEDTDPVQDELVEGMITHLETLMELVYEGHVTSLISITEGDFTDTNTQVTFSGHSNNPYRLHYYLDNNIPDIFKDLFIESYYEEDYD